MPKEISGLAYNPIRQLRTSSPCSNGGRYIILTALCFLMMISSCAWMERRPVDYVSWTAGFGKHEPEDSKAMERKYKEESLPMYLATHKDIPDDISKGLQLQRVVRGMNKEQTRLILGEPEEIIKAQTGREVWWYYKSSSGGCLMQPVLLPFCLVSPAFYDVGRREIYWNEDKVEDLQQYQATGPLTRLP